MLTAFRWLFYTSAKLGLCSSSSTLHQSRPLVSKQLSTCQGGILHVPSWAITLLPHSLGIKSAICSCISDKHFIFFPSTYPSVRTSIVLCPLVCLSFASWAPAAAHMCRPPCPIAWSDGAKSYPRRFVIACTLRQRHVRHLCIVHSPASRAQPFGNQRDVTAWLICDCFLAKTWGLASPPRAQHYKARQITYYFPGLYKALSHEFSWTIPKWRGIITKHCIKISSLPSPLLFHFPSKMNLCPARLKHNIKELMLF